MGAMDGPNMNNEDVSFTDLRGQISKFKSLQIKHNELLDTKKTDLQQKKDLVDKLAREIDQLEGDLSAMEQRKLDLDRTIQEADKAYSRIVGSTQTLASVIDSEMTRCQDTKLM